ncbi:MAG: hypothetical protein IJY61_07560, partial [Candidatus Gastranaerophilales bacterium]|nr:hypothetical protein [Candidatus Gastranaerophilales bacterium]
NNLKDKFTERANTLFTSMKDEEEDKNYKIDKKENIKEKIRGLGKTKDVKSGDKITLEKTEDCFIDYNYYFSTYIH